MTPVWWRHENRKGRWFLVDDDDPMHSSDQPEFIGSMWRYDDDETDNTPNPKSVWEVRTKRPEKTSVLLTYLDAHLTVDEAKGIAKTLIMANWSPS